MIFVQFHSYVIKSDDAGQSQEELTAKRTKNTDKKEKNRTRMSQIWTDEHGEEKSGASILFSAWSCTRSTVDIICIFSCPSPALSPRLLVKGPGVSKCDYLFWSVFIRFYLLDLRAILLLTSLQWILSKSCLKLSWLINLYIFSIYIRNFYLIDTVLPVWSYIHS